MAFFKKDFILIRGYEIPDPEKVKVRTTVGELITSHKYELDNDIIVYCFKPTKNLIDKSTFIYPSCIKPFSPKKFKSLKSLKSPKDERRLIELEMANDSLKARILELEKELVVIKKAELMKSELLKYMQEENEKLKKPVLSPIGTKTFGELNLEVIRTLY